MVITAVGDSSTLRGGGIGKSLGWKNVVSPSNQVTVIVSTTKKHVHISFYGTTIGFARTCLSTKNSLCADIVLFVWILSIDCTLILRPVFIHVSTGNAPHSTQSHAISGSLRGLQCCFKVVKHL